MQRLLVLSLSFFLTLQVFAQQGAAPKPNPVEIQDAALWLVGEMPSSSLQRLIEERRANFSSGKDTDQTLRLFGADDELIKALKTHAVGKSKIKPDDLAALHEAVQSGHAAK